MEDALQFKLLNLKAGNHTGSKRFIHDINVVVVVVVGYGDISIMLVIVVVKDPGGGDFAVVVCFSFHDSHWLGTRFPVFDKAMIGVELHIVW